MTLIPTLKSSLLLGALFVSWSSVAIASPAFKICALYPHLKDSYWLSVNYGMVQEAQAQNVTLKVLEAGGYPNQSKQAAQLQRCRDWQADAILLGTVAPDIYLGKLSQLSADIPVFATINQLDSAEHGDDVLLGEVGVDWYQMGYFSGEFLAKRHPKGSGHVNVAVLPGPVASGGTKPVMQGIEAAIKGSDVTITGVHWADNDKELQRNLVQRVTENLDIHYLIGSAVAIEAAISELRLGGKSAQIGLVSTYLSHGVYRGLLRNKVLFAPSDQMVLQGRLSVRQAVQSLKQAPFDRHIAPDIVKLTPNHLPRSVIEASLSPSEYRPIFNVLAKE